MSCPAGAEGCACNAVMECARIDSLEAERDEARETAYAARRIADKHAATVTELRAMVERLTDRIHAEAVRNDLRLGARRDRAEREADKDVDVRHARVLLERTAP